MAVGKTVCRAFADTVARRPDEVALRWRDAGTWRSWSWNRYGEEVAAVAAGLSSLGVQRGEFIVLMTRNRPEFHVADLAALLVGAVPVSLYNSSSAEQIAYAAAHCGASVAVVESPEFLERFLRVRYQLPNLRHLVVVSDPEGIAPADVIRFGQLRASAPLDLPAAAAAGRPEDLATLIYTSGTTGTPKGVMVTNANVAWTVDSVLRALGHGISGFETISFLPMAHIAERMMTHYAHVFEGTEVTTCPEPGRISNYLRDVRPRLVFAVPRVWEKACSTIRSLAACAPDGGVAFDEALETGRRMDEVRRDGGANPPGAEEAERVLSAVRDATGLDRCQIAVTAAAPIAPEVIVFFRSLGVPLSEVYGLSESCGPVSWDPYEVHPGDTGRPIPGCEVEIAPDREILVRGGNVFGGYLHEPERTARTLDERGWLHTGDLGSLTDGRLRIEGRKKDLIVTAGGENVAPAKVETALQGAPLVEQACVAGDRRPYLVALVTIDPEALREWGRDTGFEDLSPCELLHLAELRREVERQVSEASEGLSRPERVRRLAILDHEWAVDSEELTPTMKVRRDHILERYAAEVERLYD